MTEYKLIVNHDKAVILDENGQPVSPRAGQPVMKALQETYPREAWVYILHWPSEDIYKIGMTAQPINSRLSQIRHDEGMSDLVLIHTIPCDSVSRAADLEFMLHSLYVSGHVRSEWFEIADDQIDVLKLPINWLSAFTHYLPVWERQNPNGFVKGSREEAVYRRGCMAYDAYMRLHYKREEQLSQLHDKVDEIHAIRDSLFRELQRLNAELKQAINEHNDLARLPLPELMHRQKFSIE